jgi:FlgD Ig-like domain
MLAQREVKTMKFRTKSFIAAILLVCMIPAASLAVDPYFQDFEDMDFVSTTALSGDGWRYYGNVSDTDGTYLYGYGGEAPNDGTGFSGVVIEQGGVDQGFQQLVVYSDYNNFSAHDLGYNVESNVFQEQTIVTADIGKTWKFSFQAKRGDIALGSTAFAFIKTIDPQSNYDMTNYINVEMTAIPETWSGYSLSINIIPELVGQLLQIGFLNNATSFEASSIYYDNVLLEEDDTSDVPVGFGAVGATLRQNYPNPFNPLTRIEFALDRPGNMDISVYDIAGRHITTLHRGDLEAGEHYVTWDGKTSSGNTVPSGQYRYVLKTADGQTSRSMVLLK